VKRRIETKQNKKNKNRVRERKSEREIEREKGARDGSLTAVVLM